MSSAIAGTNPAIMKGQFMKKSNIWQLIILISCSCAYSSSDSEWISPKDLPCWQQSWSAGNWIPAPPELCGPDEPNDALPIEVREKPDAEPNIVLYSSWASCGSIRIINLRACKQRIILCNSDRLNGLKGGWLRARPNSSVDELAKDDMLLMYFKNSLYLIKIDRICPAEHLNMIYYGYSTISDSGKIPKTISLKGLHWKGFQAENGIKINDAKLKFGTFILFQEKGLKDLGPRMAVRYPFGYGYSDKPEIKSDADVPHIAIVHQNKIKDNTIDVLKFRFKTWEDGLGAECETEKGK
jgi:hypothetical protein